MLEYLNRIIEELEIAEDELKPTDFRDLIRELQIALESKSY